MLDPELLKILVCPETHQPLALADPQLVRQLNDRISAGTLKCRAGQPVQEAIDGGLIREDKRVLYAIRNDIPVMLIDEAIPLPG